MLAIFYGCSCVGKTSIMDVLHFRYGWQFITIFTTRESRQKEVYKFNLSRDIFEQKAQKEEVSLVNECYQNFYGVSNEDLSHAISNEEKVWMLDFSLANQHQLNNLPNVRQIIVLPEDEFQLTIQIHESFRSNRAELIIEEYRNYYSKLDEGFNPGLNSLCIINSRNCLDKSVEAVKFFVSHSGGS